jgi:hypothetical protein
VPLVPSRPGAQSPRPASVPPMAGASRPPGRALASVSLAERESGDVVTVGGERQCLSFSAQFSVWQPFLKEGARPLFGP